MRRKTLATLAVVLMSCAPVGSSILEEEARAPEGKAPASREDPFEGVPEVVVREEMPHYDYPANLYETPAGASRIRTGRWKAEWEGSGFTDNESGEWFCTVGVDDALYDFVTIGETYYDWNACLEATIEAAVADYPSPFFP